MLQVDFDASLVQPLVAALSRAAIERGAMGDANGQNWSNILLALAKLKVSEARLMWFICSMLPSVKYIYRIYIYKYTVYI